MNKRDFVPLAANPQQLAQSDKRLLTYKERVIKRHRVNDLSFIHDYHPGPITEEDNEPEIQVEEKDGQIVRIHFMCPCGCKATVELVPDA